MKALVKCLIIIASVIVLGGCSTYSSNMQVGNDQSYLSLKDQREAIRAVAQYDSLPEDATVLGKVNAARCHRSLAEKLPDETMVVIDLKVAAYARGADGIADVKITKQSGLTKNCWHIIDAEAVIFMNKPTAQSIP